MTGRHCAIWTLMATLFCGVAVAQDGYVVQSDRIVTEGASQWRQWIFPEGTIDIDAGGARPHFVQPVINASLDVGRFPLAAEEDEKGGILAAGTSGASAPRMLDGNAATYWEPNIDDPQDLWWVAIDLGRMVSAERIVLRFAEEGSGDPFHQFRLMVADGEAKIGENHDYHLVGKTDRPNTEQREFSFELTPFQSADPDYIGDAFRFVQVVMTDSRMGKAEEVDSVAYRNLPPELQGDIEYFGRSRTGSEWLLDEEAYGLLDLAEQGTIRYYRREQPRLAELEVWTLGENVGLGTIERGGSVEGHGINHSRSFDGDYTTWYSLQQGFSGEAAETERRIVFDLGALFWLDLFHFLPPAARSAGSTLGAYRMKLSDGTLAPDGTLKWTQVEDRRSFSQPRWQHVDFELQKVRYVAFDYLIEQRRGLRRSGWSEFQAFGEGYQPEVVFESPLIDLNNSRNLTTLHWEADVPPGTRIEVETRTGDEIQVNVFFYRKGGVEISREDYYEKTIAALRGDSVSVLAVDEENWSPWSKPHLVSGEEITSPSPRRFMKSRVKLFSDDPQASAQLRRLEVRFARPWVRRVLGEVYPVLVERVGEATPLTFFVRPERGGGDPGIDEVLLVSSGQTPLALEGVRLGDEAAVGEGGGEALDLAGVEVLATGADSLWVQLPAVVGRNEVVALDVSTTLFGHGVAFSGRVGNSDNSGVWQLVEADQAAVEEVESGVLKVLAPSGQTGLADLAVRSRVVTPNGDGANDAALVNFDVLRMDGTQTVIVAVYDLSGRRVWTLEQARPRASGQYEVAWPGVDAAGDLVPPGAYILRVEVDADASTDVRSDMMQTVYVAY